MYKYNCKFTILLEISKSDGNIDCVNNNHTSCVNPISLTYKYFAKILIPTAYIPDVNIAFHYTLEEKSK